MKAHKCLIGGHSDFQDSFATLLEQNCFHLQGEKKDKQIVLLYRVNTLAFKTIFQSRPIYLKNRLVPQFTINYIQQDDFVLRAPCPSTLGKPKIR